MKNAILIILLITSISCNDKRIDKFWFLEIDQDYNRVKGVFENYVDFFPKESNCYSLNCTWSLDQTDEYNLKVVFEFNDEMFNEEKRKIEEDAIAKYLAGNDSVLVLNRFSTNKNYGYPDKSEIERELIEQDHFKEFKPIPNFSNFSAYNTNTTVCKLPKDFSIYVLESKPGIFLKENQLTDGEYMPKVWKHGYSKGVAISSKRKEMIYWVIIW